MLRLRKLGACLGLFVVWSAGNPGAVAPSPELWWSVLRRPTPLSAAEEASPAVQALARRFNPAMAFPQRGVWPVEVRYTWKDGADLVAKVLDGSDVVQRYVAVPNADLERRSWADLPRQDARGRAIRYEIDAPGDDDERDGRTRWRERWEALVGRDDDVSPEGNDGGDRDRHLSASAFPPTQYAHVFWYNREEGLLGIQYWFFYPFNEWVNRHEGDWEHVNVILKGPSRLDDDAGFRPVGYQFSFHSWRYETERVVRVGGPQPGEDHVVVFVGGRGRFLFWKGSMSGASYPLPAFYPGAGSGPVAPGEDTRDPERFIAAQRFQVIVLPEPERLDAAAHPELSWLRLPFYAGQERVRSNPPLVNWLGHGASVLQPAQRRTWNAMHGKPLWAHTATMLARSLTLPAEWPILAAPWLRHDAIAAPAREDTAPDDPARAGINLPAFLGSTPP